MFAIAVTIAVLIAIWFVAHYAYEAHQHEWRYISERSRAMYVDVAKTLITASGVALAIVISALSGKFSPPMWIVQRAVVLLIVCIVASIVVILLLSRGFERAISRSENDDEGRLSNAELYSILVAAWFALLGFLIGFLYLARIAFFIT